MTPDYEKQYFSDNDIYIVCGHTPTKAICNEWKIYHSITTSALIVALILTENSHVYV